jgi:hypothetical protein
MKGKEKTKNCKEKKRKGKFHTKKRRKEREIR